MTTRFDGRTPDELRPVEIEIDFTDVPAASVLIDMGKTRVLCTASVEDSVPRWLRGKEPPQGWVTAEYEMLPGSTSPRGRRSRRSVGGRTKEIQRLIGRSLRGIIDLEKLGERTIWLDCEVLQADGGTRTASVTGAFVALALACGRMLEAGELEEMPLRDTIAAISCGVVDGEALLDLPYEEDVAAAVDMNVVMTGGGEFVELQGTGEEATFTADELSALLDLATRGIADLTKIQRAALPEAEIYDELFG
ncbi:MAG: ribonuclease PH [Myxococcota bacterium]